MTYENYDKTRPDAAVDSGVATLGWLRRNQQALLRMLVTTGNIQGFDYQPYGGSAAQPAMALFRAGTEVIRVDVTWGTTGGAAGNPTQFAYYYAADESDAGWPATMNGTYEPMVDDGGKFVQTINYDAQSYITSAPWGAAL